MAVGAGAAMLHVGFTLGLAPAVFLVESLIAYRVFRGVAVATPILAVVIANFISSIAGYIVGDFAPVDARFRTLTRGAPQDDQILALMALCIPFFVLSVLIEFLVASRVISKQHDTLTFRWAMEANIVSYIMIEAVLLVTLLMMRSARGHQLFSPLW